MPVGEGAMIRRAHASDISQVAALYHAVWHETQAPFMPRPEITHRSMQFFVDRMTALLQSTLVAERNGEIAAFSAMERPAFGPTVRRGAPSRDGRRVKSADSL
jgi:hypothetical protein